MKHPIVVALAGGLVVGGALALPALIDAADDDGPVSEFVPHPNEIVADYTSFDISDDRRRISVTTFDPTSRLCTEPVELAVEVGDDFVVLRPIFRTLSADTLCEQACDRHTLSTRVDEPLPQDLTVVADPERVPICGS